MTKLSIRTDVMVELDDTPILVPLGGSPFEAAKAAAARLQMAPIYFHCHGDHGNPKNDRFDPIEPVGQISVLMDADDEAWMSYDIFEKSQPLPSS